MMEFEEKNIRRNREVKLRFGKEEKMKLEKKAEELGLTVSQYIRLVSIKSTIDIR